MKTYKDKLTTAEKIELFRLQSRFEQQLYRRVLVLAIHQLQFDSKLKGMGV